MLNAEKYKEEILKKAKEKKDAKLNNYPLFHAIDDILKEHLSFERAIEWLLSEYEPPLLENGDKLKVGDWIMVRDDAQDGWIKRQFCYFYKDHFYCAKCESNLEEQTITCVEWIYARLPEEGE